jgi:hypothetical protein
MEVTRHNYEEYFILYIDNELNAAERKAVDLFVQENPDLEEELIMLQQSVLRPDEKMVFGRTENLLKDTASQGLVNEGNYEEYFVIYGDDELNNEEKDLVEQFVYKYPQYQAEFELIQQARLVPESISFPDKTYLYRTEEDDNKVVPFGWWRMIAAAVVLLAVGSLGWFMSDNDENGANRMATVKDTQRIEEKKTPVVVPVKEAEPSTTTIAKTAPEKTSKKIPVTSNKPVAEYVQYKTEPMTPVQTPAINDAQLAVKPVDVAVPSYTKAPVVNTIVDKQTVVSQPVAATAIAATTADEMHDSKTYVLNTSVNKTPLRGFFRKVSRVVNKATSFEVSGDEKGGVRIANFEVALK